MLDDAKRPNASRVAHPGDANAPISMSSAHKAAAGVKGPRNRRCSVSCRVREREVGFNTSPGPGIMGDSNSQNILKNRPSPLPACRHQLELDTLPSTPLSSQWAQNIDAGVALAKQAATDPKSLLTPASGARAAPATSPQPPPPPPQQPTSKLLLLGSPTHGVGSLYVPLLNLEIHVLFPDARQLLAELVSRVL